MKIDLLDEYCKQLRNLPAGWRHISWERVDGVEGDMLKVDGAVFGDKPDGGPDWKSRDKTTECTFVISLKAQSAWVEEWEQRTNQCQRCVNTPGVWEYGWSAKSGKMTKPCPRCNATGKAPVKAEVKPNLSPAN